MNHYVARAVWVVVVSVCTIAFAQKDKEPAAFDALQLHRFGLLEGNLDGIIHRLAEGVKMTLIAESTEDNIDVEAETVTFSYENEGETMPTHVLFEKNVVFTHAEGTINSQKATLNFESQEAVFTGNPTADLAAIRGAKAESITMNLETGDIVARHGSVDELILRDPKQDPSSTTRN